MRTRLGSQAEDACEKQLLCAASCLTIPESVVTSLVAQHSRALDWSRIFVLGIPHGILPLLSLHLEGPLHALAPEAAKMELAKYRLLVSSRNIALRKSLLEVLQVLAAAGIRALPFKGLTLATLAYPDLSLRELHDHDIFIPPSALSEIGRIMTGCGFVPVHHVRGKPIAIKPGSTFGHNERPEYTSADGKTIIEFHDQLVPPEFSFPLDFEEAWMRREYVVVGDTKVATLHSQDLLIYLCVHGARHLWRRLNWVADLTALMTARPVLDGKGLLTRAADLKSARRFLIGLALARNLTGFEQLDPYLQGRLRHDTSISSLARRVTGSMFEEPTQRTAQNFMGDLRFHLTAADSLRGRFRVLRYYLREKLLRADAERMVLPMGKGLQSTYRAWNRIRRLSRRASGDPGADGESTT